MEHENVRGDFEDQLEMGGCLPPDGSEVHPEAEGFMSRFSSQTGGRTGPDINKDLNFQENSENKSKKTSTLHEKSVYSLL